MGRKNKSYSKSLHQQAYDKLVSMQAFGESKQAAKVDGTADSKIFSFSTYKSYSKHVNYFLDFIEEKHPEITTLAKARPYVNEWLQSRLDQINANGEHLSAWTIQLETAALAKLYGIKPNDPDRFVPPTRRREDIKRSRVSVVRDSHFSLTNNDELIKFCRGTGLRRAGLESIRGKDLFTREQIEREIRRLQFKENDLSNLEKKWLKICKDTQIFTKSEHKYFVCVTEKGGRTRMSPIVGPDVDQIVNRFKETKPDQKVWKYIHSAADVHGYRADYARRVYNDYARPIDELNKNQIYRCKLDEKGKELDRHAMMAASKALGHSRIEVVARNYLRGL